MAPTRKRTDQGKAALQFLRQQYPLAFCSPPRPLASNVARILLDRHADALGATAIFQALRIYTNWIHFQNAFVPGAVRYDLHGYPVGIVTEAEVTEARAKLEEANQRRQQRWRAFHARKAISPG